MDITLQNIEQYLNKKGLSPLLHRVKVLEYFVKHRNHPTVDIIHKDLSKEIPSLSKTTVYNILRVFIENNIVKELNLIDTKEARYDIKSKGHAHFKCKQCGTIYDVELDTDDIKRRLSGKNVVEECQVALKGVCEQCKS